MLGCFLHLVKIMRMWCWKTLSLNSRLLLLTGIYPQAVDLSQLQGLPPALLGQPLYPLGPTGHPLLAPRAGTHIQLAVLQQQQQQQQLQQQRPCELFIQRVDLSLQTGVEIGCG